MPGAPVDRIEDRWATLKATLDSLTNDTGNQSLRDLLQECVQAGRETTSADARLTLQLIAREIVGILLTRTGTYHDAMIAPAAEPDDTLNRNAGSRPIRAALALGVVALVVFAAWVGVTVFIADQAFRRGTEQRTNEIKQLNEEKVEREKEKAQVSAQLAQLRDTTTTWGQQVEWLAQEIPAERREAVATELCLRIIRTSQLPDGSLRMVTGVQSEKIQPAFTNYAALGMLAVHAAAPDRADRADDLRRVRMWLSWYKQHQQLNGTIADHTHNRVSGTLTADVANDSSAAGFLIVAYQYRQATGTALPEEFRVAVERAFGALTERLDKTDGLPWGDFDADLNKRTKWLIMSVEYGAALSAAARLLAEFKAEEPAKRAAESATHLRTSLDKQFWREDKGAFAAYFRGTEFATQLDALYPAAQANLYGLIWIAPEKPELWKTLRTKFKPGTGQPADAPVELWLMAALAGGLNDEAAELRKQTIGAALSFAPNNVNLDRTGIVLLALSKKAEWLQTASQAVAKVGYLAGSSSMTHSP